MEIIISGRNLDIDASMKSYIEDKVQKLAEEYSKLTTVRVVMSLERSWHVVEMHVHGKNVSLDAKSTSRDMYISIDSVTDKMEKQLRKYLDRIQEHRGSKKIVVEEELAEEDDQEDFVEEEYSVL